MRVTLAGVLALIGLVALAAPAQAVPYPPNAFYGTVSVGASPAADGLTVSARIGDVQYAVTTTSGGGYGYDPWFNVPSDDPDTSEKEGGVNGDTVNFYVNGVKAEQEAVFEWGERVRLDLSITALPADKLKITSSPLTLTAGTRGTITIQVQDEVGNPQPSGAYVIDLASDSTASRFYAEGTGDVITDVTIAEGASSAMVDYYDERAGTPLVTVTAVGLNSDSQQQTVNHAAIDSYSVSAIPSPQTVDTAFSVSVQARDAYANDVTTGEHASETVDISFGKADGGATPRSATVTNGAATLSVTMTVAQSGQTITFTGATSGKTGVSNSFDVQAKAPAGAGGGGAGGAAPSPAPSLEAELFGRASTYSMTSTGEILDPIAGSSQDGKLTITISKGTVALDRAGQPLRNLTVNMNDTPLSPPAGAHVIGLAYDFAPTGASFAPAISVSWSYDADDLPADVAEKDLAIAYYDKDAGDWLGVDSEVDTDSDTVTAQVAHFTTFALLGYEMAKPAVSPASFSLSGLVVSPSVAKVGESVEISVTVRNTGGQSGIHTIAVKINGVIEATRRVTLAAGASQEVSFVITKDAGSYSVAIGDLSGSFKLEEKAVGELSPTPSPTPEPTPTPTPEPTPPQPGESVPPEPAVTWPLIAGIATAVVVVGLVAFLLVRRRAR